MQFETVKADVIGIAGAIVSSLCCLLPLTVVLLGLESGTFMMVTMHIGHYSCLWACSASR